MSIPVELGELAEAMAVYRFAYLLSLADDGRPHAVAVVPELVGGELVVGDLGRRSRGNLTARSAATLLWPPTDPGGYSLIVDGDASAVGEDPRDGTRTVVRIVPSRAVLHRSAVPAGATGATGGAGAAAAPVAGGPAPGCVSDCVEISLSAG